MMRRRGNQAERFSETVDANASETEASLRQRRREMCQAWGDMDKRWRDLEERLAKIGIAKLTDSDENATLWLNVGGSQINIRRSVLRGHPPSTNSALAALFDVEWGSRLPRDSDGRLLLDENPVCVKYMLHNLLKSGGRSIFGVAPDDEFPADQKAYLPYVSSVLGLSGVGTAVSGGSTVLEANEVGPLTAMIRSWCPGKPQGLNLLYRASRDGWTAAAFHKKCDSSDSTITLVRVKSRGDNITHDSVVGGFSSVPWENVKAPASGHGNCYCPSPGSFLFMLKEGSGTDPGNFLPARWGVVKGEEQYAVYCGPCIGPTFGGGYDLHINWNNGSPPTTFATRAGTYDIPDISRFSVLTGRPVVEIEVFGLCSTTTTVEPWPAEPARGSPTDVSKPAPVRTAAISAGDEGDDIHAFGSLVAGSLMEERMALRDAEIEVLEAGARARAAADAFAAVYGPGVSEGEEEDPVVELNVRGSRVTTLLSTLQACPDSALAARFDKSKWPATENEVDDQGRMAVDCSPSVFGKVLDVLRMRKRAAWEGKASQGQDLVRVTIKAADRDSFEEFVDKYFPGDLQRFIVDCVDTVKG